MALEGCCVLSGCLSEVYMWDPVIEKAFDHVSSTQVARE